MRTMFVATATALLLGACASSETLTSYSEDIDALQRDCQARGGMLQAPRAGTLNAASDYPCVIRGGATRIPSQ
jgi:hypothetical protein